MSLHDRLRAIRARHSPGNASPDTWVSTSQTSDGEPDPLLPHSNSHSNSHSAEPAGLSHDYPVIEPVPLDLALSTPSGFTQLAPFLQSRIVTCPLLEAGVRRYFIPEEVDRARLVFLDLETTGLGGGAGNMAFLIGLGRIGPDSLEVEQVLLQDYPGEPELLSYLQSRLSAEDWIISYNGLSFDCALLRDRFAMHGRRRSFERQFDLLYPVRTLYRRRLSNCSLSTVESELLQIRRPVDLPGAFAPERYFQYLRQGDIKILSEVCAHHVQDVFGLYLLWVHLEELCGRAARGEDLDTLAAPAGYVAPADPVALGRLLFSGRRPGLRGRATDGSVPAAQSRKLPASSVIDDTIGPHARGEALLKNAVYAPQVFPAERREAGFELGRYYNSHGRWNEAYDVFLYLHSEVHDRAAGVEVAKLLEHRLGDVTGAAEVVRVLLRGAQGRRQGGGHVARRTMEQSSKSTTAKNARAATSTEALRYRLARLERKIAGMERKIARQQS